MNWYSLPETIESEVFTVMPAGLRRSVITDWARANKGGQPVDCFLEGPCFDASGNLHVVDVPHGRIFRIAPDASWTLLAEWDGEPNGLAFHPDGRLLIADYKNGLLSLDPAGGAPQPYLARRNGERFKGVNDLIVSRAGDIYFTDQGQTGLHDQSGRVFRLTPSGRLDCLLATGVSPNGLVLSADERVLFVAMTRDNAVWRVPLQEDGGVSKVGRFASFHGTSGPDGMVMDADGNLLVAHASLGAVLVLGPQGEPLARIRSCRGQTVTNLTFDRADRALVYMTESQTGSVLRARWRREGLSVGHR